MNNDFRQYPAGFAGPFEYIRKDRGKSGEKSTSDLICQSRTKNEHLKKEGIVKLLPEENGVEITNPVIDRDASLFQDIKVDDYKWFTFFNSA